MFDLKPISAAGVPAALQKAERYRLLNEPEAAESICLDVLAAAPEQQQAAVMLLLSITDQFRRGSPAEHEQRARAVLPQLADDYKRAYYEGIICERRAMAQLALGAPGAGEMAYDGFREAMAHYEHAERLRPAGNDEAILRWNTCARILDRQGEHVRPRDEEEYEPSFE